MLNNIWTKSSPNLWKLWCWCLMRANFEDKLHPFNGEMIHLKEGQFITGKFQGAKEVYLKPDNFWQLLKRLEKIECISLNTKAKAYTIVTIVNWSKYQHPENTNIHTQIDTQQHTQQNNANYPDTHSVSEIKKGLHTQLHTQQHHTDKNKEERIIYTPDLFSEDESDVNIDSDKTVSKSDTQHPLHVWIESELDIVRKFEKQLTFEQCESLLQKYDKETIKDTLNSLNNFPKANKKYRSVYHTIQNWLKRNEQFRSKSGGKYPQHPEQNIKYFN